MFHHQKKEIEIITVPPQEEKAISLKDLLPPIEEKNEKSIEVVKSQNINESKIENQNNFSASPKKKKKKKKKKTNSDNNFPNKNFDNNFVSKPQVSSTVENKVKPEIVKTDKPPVEYPAPQKIKPDEIVQFPDKGNNEQPDDKKNDDDWDDSWRWDK